MEIQYCPILRPSLKQFQNFREFVEKLDKTYKSNVGMVKVVPPPGWKPRMSDITPVLKNLMVNGPIEQNIFGKAGIYQCLHIPKKSLTFSQYKFKTQDLDKITDNMKTEQVQTMFWKNVAFSPPLYGADLLNTLMEDCSNGWNLNHLDSVLMDSVSQKIKGINTPYCYVGSWKALFCWHKQDLDLSAINYLHDGKSKFWYCIQNQDAKILEEQAKRLYPQQFSKCSQFLRHKTILINPHYLKKKYPHLKIVKAEQKKNQFILSFGSSYHCGFNFGFNIAEAVNYGTLDWLTQLLGSKSCKCSKGSVQASYIQILRNLQKSKVKNTPQFKQFQTKVNKILRQEQQRNIQSQDEIGQERKQIKVALGKMIKKSKKPMNKLKYKNEQYQIQNWAQCDKCNTWRIVQLKVPSNKSFNCKLIGKQCKKRQYISKNIVTL